jgi:hypothetical protein
LNGIQEVSGSTPLSSTIRPSPQNGGGLFIWGVGTPVLLLVLGEGVICSLIG